MTKLEKKLIELGYEKREVFYQNNDIYRTKYIKSVNNVAYIELNVYEKYTYCVNNEYAITDQSMIDKIQQAFNTLQQDLELLKEYFDEKED